MQTDRSEKKKNFRLDCLMLLTPLHFSSLIEKTVGTTALSEKVTASDDRQFRLSMTGKHQIQGAPLYGTAQTQTVHRHHPPSHTSAVGSTEPRPAFYGDIPKKKKNQINENDSNNI